MEADSACPACGDLQFTAGGLLAQYPLPVRQSFDVESLDLFDDPNAQLALHLWREVTRGDGPEVPDNGAFDLLKSPKWLPWLNGLIHRAWHDSRPEAAHMLTAVRETARAHSNPIVPSTLLPPATHSASIFAEMSQDIVSRKTTTAAAIQSIQTNIEQTQLMKLLEEYLNSFSQSPQVSRVDMIGAFLVAQLCEELWSTAGVSHALSLAAYAANELGLPCQCLVLLRVGYMTAAELANQSEAVNSLQNALTVVARSKDPATAAVAAEMFVELYGGPPWLHGGVCEQVLAACSQALAHTIASTHLSLDSRTALAARLASVVTDAFFGNALFLSLESYTGQGMNDEAERLIDFVEDVARRTNREEILAAVCHYRGMIEKARGNYGTAAVLLERAMEDMARLRGSIDPDNLHGLITVQTEAGWAKEARQGYHQFIRLFGCDNRYRSNILGLAGLIEMAEGRLTEAAELFQEAQSFVHLMPEANRHGWEAVLRNNQMKCVVASRLRGEEGSPTATELDRLPALSRAHALSAAGISLFDTDPSLAANQFDAAARAFEALLRPDLEAVERMNAGSASSRARQFANAVTHFERARSLLDSQSAIGDIVGLSQDGSPVNRSTLDDLLQAARAALTAESVPGPDPSRVPGSGTVDVANLFKYLCRKQSARMLDDGELATHVRDEETAKSLTVSFAVNAALNSGLIADEYAELAYRLFRKLAAPPDDLICIVVAKALCAVGRNETASELVTTYLDRESIPAEYIEMSPEVFSLGKSSSRAMERYASALIAASDSGSNRQGYQTMSYVSAARGEWHVALRQLGQAWDAAHLESGQSVAAKGSLAIAMSAAEICVFRLEALASAQIWLDRAESAGADPVSRDMRRLRAATAAILGQFNEAEALYSELLKEMEAEHNAVLAAEFEVNLLAILVKRRKIRGQKARDQLLRFIEKCRRIDAGSTSRAAAKLLGDFETVEGNPDAASVAYGEARRPGPNTLPASFEASMRIVDIQNIGDPSARLTALLSALRDWEDLTAFPVHRVKALSLTAQLLLQGVDPTPAGEPLLADLTPPIPMFTASFECCRRAENLAREHRLYGELAGVLHLMGLSLLQTWHSGSLFSPAGLFIEARKLAEREMYSRVDQAGRAEYADLVQDLDRAVLHMAYIQNDASVIDEGFRAIRYREDEVLAGGVFIAETGDNLSAEGGTGAAAELVEMIESLRQEIHYLRLLLSTPGVKQDGAVASRYELLLSEYVARWRQAERSLIAAHQTSSTSGLTGESKDALGHSTYNTYDTLRRLWYTKDPNNNITTSIYDAASQRIATLNPLNQLWTTTYNPVGKIVSFTDQSNLVSNTFYDPLNRVLARVDPMGYATSFAYDTANRQASVRDGNGNYTTTIYDASGRVMATQKALGFLTSFFYDAAGQTIATQDALNNLWSTSYDANGRVVSQTDPLSNVTQFSYDAVGRRIAVEDPLGHITSAGYDLAGRMTSQTDPRNYQTNLSYYPTGWLKAVTDANGNYTTHTYDGNGRLKAVQDARSHFTTYSYDAVGNMVMKVMPSGLITTPTYDAMHQVGRIYYVGTYTHQVYEWQNGQPRYQTDYDPDGLRMNWWFNNGQLEYTQFFYPTGPRTTLYYDPAGNMTRLQPPSGGTSKYTYDNQNRLAGIDSYLGEYTTLTYDALDRTKTELLANGVTVSHSYDAAGRETARAFLAPGGGWLAGFTATYDSAGNRLSQAESQYVSGSLVSRLTSYSYDPSNQLLSETCSGANAYSYLYSYDGVGNRLSRVYNGQPTTYMYGAMNQIASQQLYAGALTTFVYDLDGNLLVSNEGSGLSTYTWDVKGMLASVDSSAGLSSFTHDIDACRRLRQVPSANGTSYTWVGPHVIQENDSVTGALQVEYTFSPWEDSATPAYGALGHLYSQNSGGSSQFFGFDLAGNTRMLMNSSGAITDTLLFSAFGEELNRTGSSLLYYGFGGEAGYISDNGQLADVRNRVYSPFNEAMSLLESGEITEEKYIRMQAQSLTHSKAKNVFGRSLGKEVIGAIIDQLVADIIECSANCYGYVDNPWIEIVADILPLLAS